MPLRRALPVDEHAADVKQPEDAVAQWKERAPPAQVDVEIRVRGYGCVASESVEVVSAEKIAARHAGRVQWRSRRRATQESGFEERIRPPVALPREARAQLHVGQDVGAVKRCDLSAHFPECSRIAEDGGRFAYGQVGDDVTQERIVAAALIERETRLNAPDRHSVGSLRPQLTDEPPDLLHARCVLERHSGARPQSGHQRHLDQGVHNDLVLQRFVEIVRR